MPALLKRVTGVGNELPDENLFVRVQRVRDYIKKTLGFGLEGVRCGGAA